MAPACRYCEDYCMIRDQLCETSFTSSRAARLVATGRAAACGPPWPSRAGRPRHVRGQYRRTAAMSTSNGTRDQALTPALHPWPFGPQGGQAGCTDRRRGSHDSVVAFGSVSESREVGETIGYQLRRLRRLRGLTQEELADRADVSRDLVAKLEQGRRQTARLSSLASFARALDVELSALVERAMPVLEIEDSEADGPVALRNIQTAPATVDRDMPELSLSLGGCEPHDAASVIGLDVS